METCQKWEMETTKMETFYNKELSHSKNGNFPKQGFNMEITQEMQGKTSKTSH